MFYGKTVFDKPKYNNTKIEIDGITFDSRREAKRYSELKLLERCNAISQLELQKVFVLVPAQFEIVNGKKKAIERAVKYKADFYYYDNEKNCFVCEDTKGFKTKDYIIKRKLMLYVHGIRIVEI